MVAVVVGAVGGAVPTTIFRSDGGAVAGARSAAYGWRMRIARAGLVVTLVVTMAASSAPAETSLGRGLSLEQIRGVMRAHAEAFNACLAAANRSGKPLHGPFLYQIEVDKKGKVTSAHPYQPSAAASFDRCVTGVLKRAKFPGGPASVETPLVFDPS